MGILATSPASYLLTSNLFHFVFCIALIVYMRMALNNNFSSTSRREFKKFMLIVLAGLCFDMLSYVFDRHDSTFAYVMSHVTMFGSVSLTAFTGYWWNRFFDVLFKIERKGVKHQILYLLPTICAVILLIVNIPTGCIFYMIEGNVYVRGKFYFLSFALQYIAFVVLTIRALLVKIDIATLRRRKMRRNLIWVGIVTFVFGAFQVAANGEVALHCLGITAGMFIIFCRFQDDQITNDVLTGLNNRYALDAYIAEKMQAYASGNHGQRKLYLIMMDINDFKRINDEHGHMEGDNALKFVANLLKRIGASHRTTLFIARFGGDEFAAVYETSSEASAKNLCNEIKDLVCSETKEWKYWLTIGTGVAKYAGKEMMIDRFYSEADEALYVDKRAMCDPSAE